MTRDTLGPRRTASCSAVLPWVGPRTLTSAPSSTRAWTASAWPLNTATCSAGRPSLSTHAALAPCTRPSSLAWRPLFHGRLSQIHNDNHVFLGRIACTQSIRCGLLLQMSHVAWTVCLSVLSTRMCCVKRLNRSRCRLGADSWGPGRTNPFVSTRGDNWQVGDAAFCQSTLEFGHLLLARLHIVLGPVLFWSLAYVVVVCNTPRRRICNVTHEGAARDGGSVVLRPVMATHC